MQRSFIFEAARKLGAKFRTPADVKLMDDAIDRAERPEKPSLLPSVTPQLTSRKTPLVALLGTVAATSLLATVPAHEGLEYKAYRDIAGIWTICYGDTKNVTPRMVETKAGCIERLERQLIAHARPVMLCSPRLREPGRDWQRAAAVSLAYNIGVGGYCKSSIDRHFDAANWRAGCNAFMLYNKARVKGVLRPVRGLTRRRQEERAVCLRGVA